MDNGVQHLLGVIRLDGTFGLILKTRTGCMFFSYCLSRFSLIAKVHGCTSVGSQLVDHRHLIGFNQNFILLEGLLLSKTKIKN
jgi:hypothetical protein